MSCHGRHLGFDRTGNGAIRSAVPENLEPNMKWIGSFVGIAAISIRNLPNEKSVGRCCGVISSVRQKRSARVVQTFVTIY